MLCWNWFSIFGRVVVECVRVGFFVILWFVVVFVRCEMLEMDVFIVCMLEYEVGEIGKLKFYLMWLVFLRWKKEYNFDFIINKYFWL